MLSSVPAVAAPVIDLSAKNRARLSAIDGDPAAKKPATSLLKPRKPLTIDQLPLSFMQTAPKEDKTVMFNEYTVENEYDPMKPNDFVVEFAKRELQRRVAREDERRKADEERKRSEAITTIRLTFD